VFLLLFALLSAAYACAAMPPAPLAVAHPCCPKSGHPTTDNCQNAGCLSTAPLVLSVPSGMNLESAVQAPPVHHGLVGYLLPDRIAETVSDGPNPELYLIHRQFLI